MKVSPPSSAARAFKATATLLLLTLLGLSSIIPAVSHGVPSAEMFQAESLDEFNRLAGLGGHSIDEDLWRQANHQRKLQASTPLLAASFGGVPGFYHGVASGDPLPNAVVVWTRYTPTTPTSVISIELRMAAVDPAIPVNDHLDPAKNPNLKRAFIEVTSSSDWVAKVDVTGLKAKTAYVYAFSDGTVVSDVGQTKTAPAATDDTTQLQYAVFSCSNYGNGYFHAYDIASTIKDLDFWVHVGDYVYEYGSYSTYASDSPRRKANVLPLWEMISLQDYRLRHATYHRDEGLRNLRRRAPMITTWDDHETTNNSYGQGSVTNTGADNHQTVCSANASSPDSEKQTAQCDRNEGDVGVRFRNAAQAYMEWLPIRRGPGTMGVVNTTSITQVIEWGNLASIVAFDTRVSFRSKEPTIRDNNFANFPAAFVSLNVTAYKEPPLLNVFQQNAAALKADINNPNYTMIGKNMDILKTTFSASQTAGKPWQIWAAATMVSTHIAPDLSRTHELVNATLAPFVKGYFDAVLSAPAGGVARALVAMAQTQTPWNSDDFNGFAVERAAILKIAKENSNNAIILGGDLHDSWAWILNEGGDMTGTPVAVNLGVPGVTSPGFGSAAYPLLQGLEPLLGGRDNVYTLFNAAWKQQNPSLVYGDTQFKGFYAVKATKTTHTAEYFHIKENTILANFSAARSTSGKITADFNCARSLLTTAGVKGSLVPQASCSAVQYDTSRPAVWNIPFPLGASVTDGVTRLSRCNMDSCLFNVDTCTYREVESFQVVNTSSAIAQLEALENPASGPPIIDLATFPTCKLNVVALTKTEPAGCQQGNVRCVNLQLGANVSSNEVTAPFTLYGKEGSKYLGGAPKGGIQSLRACIHTDNTCAGQGIGCKQFTVDIRGMAVKYFRVLSGANDRVIGLIAPDATETFCMPRRRRIQIEAVSEACTTKVNFKLSPGRGRVPGSPDEVTAIAAPFRMFGSNGANLFRRGRTYTVSASSDGGEISASFKFKRCLIQ